MPSATIGERIEQQQHERHWVDVQSVIFLHILRPAIKKFLMPSIKKQDFTKGGKEKFLPLSLYETYQKDIVLKQLNVQ